MELNATISIGYNGKLEYSAVHSAGSMSDKNLNQLEALTIAHKAIEEAIAKANDTLEENGLAAQLADPRFDKYGNPIVGELPNAKKDNPDKSAPNQFRVY